MRSAPTFLISESITGRGALAARDLLSDPSLAISFLDTGGDRVVAGAEFLRRFNTSAPPAALVGLFYSSSVVTVAPFAARLGVPVPFSKKSAGAFPFLFLSFPFLSYSFVSFRF